MTMPAPPPDLDAEREVDLARWRRAVVRLWWLPVAGLIVGAVIGALLTLGGGHSYTATATIAPGQPLTPGGQPVITYQSSPVTVAGIATSEFALRKAAVTAGVSVDQLRGHVTTKVIETGVGAAAARSPVLIGITVKLSTPKPAELAANALAAIIRSQTNSKYVTQSIATYVTKINSYNAQIKTLNARINTISAALEKKKQLTFTDELILVSEQDNAEQRQGNLNDKLTTAQDQLTLAQNIEIAQVITPARAAKAATRSRGSSILTGLVIGLIIGLVAAILADRRRPAAAV